MASTTRSLRVVIDETRMPMRDGTVLTGEVAMLDVATPRPALLLRTPYGRAGAVQLLDVMGLVRAGWAVVIQDTRGRAGSGGSGAPFIHERSDGADTVAWCASQRWCDGRVTMTGGSYLGYAQWAAAIGTARQQPGGDTPLRALNSLIAPDGVRDGFIYEGGAFCLGLAATWSANQASTDNALSASTKKEVLALADGSGRLLATPHEHHRLRALYEPYDRLITATDRSFWSSIEVGSAYSELDLPVYHLAGWHDIFCESGIRAWRSMRADARSERARKSQRLVIGPWPHAGVFNHMTAEMDFGHGANGILDGTIDAMWDWMRDATDGKPVQGGAKVFVMGRNAWQELSDWPPPAVATELFPTAVKSARSRLGDGALRTAPGPAGRDRFLHDPADPVPTRGGRILGPYLPTAGPIDQRPVEERGDVLVYTSAPLDQAVTIMGKLLAHVQFETTGRSADVMVKLVDVYPDGRAMLVLDSVRREEFSPGQARPVTVRLGSVAQTFGRGHRIRVEIASSNFPRFDVNPSTGRALAATDSYEPAGQTVHHGGRTGTRLVLPVVDGRLSEEG